MPAVQRAAQTRRERRRYRWRSTPAVAIGLGTSHRARAVDARRPTRPLSSASRREPGHDPRGWHRLRDRPPRRFIRTAVGADGRGNRQRQRQGGNDGGQDRHEEHRDQHERPRRVPDRRRHVCATGAGPARPQPRRARAQQTSSTNQPAAERIERHRALLCFGILRASVFFLSDLLGEARDLGAASGSSRPPSRAGTARPIPTRTGR